jgi:hypothetical protein
LLTGSKSRGDINIVGLQTIFRPQLPPTERDCLVRAVIGTRRPSITGTFTLDAYKKSAAESQRPTAGLSGRTPEKAVIDVHAS